MSTRTRRRIPILHTAESVIPAITDAAAAFEQTRDERESLPPGSLLATNLDVGAASLTAIGTVARVMAFAPEIRALPSKHPHAFDNLLTYAHALFHAHQVWAHVGDTADDVQRLVAEASPLRVACSAFSTFA